MNGGRGSRLGILFGLCGVLALTGALLLRGHATPPVVVSATATAVPPIVAPTGAATAPAAGDTLVPNSTDQAAPTSAPAATPAPTPTDSTASAPTPTTQSGSPSDPAKIVTVEDTLTFDPQDPGSTSTARRKFLRTFSVVLGACVTPALSAECFPANGTSSAKTVHLSNEDGTDQPLGKATLGGDNPDVFALGVDTCVDTLSAASGCTVDVTFTPSKEGDYAATLTFPDAQGATLATVALKGTGQSSTPDISVDNASLALDQTSSSGTVNVSNNGKFDATLSLSLQGANSGYFSESNDCDTVSGGGNCSISVSFQPPSDVSGGIYYATIDINNTADGSTITTVDLNGTVPNSSDIVRRPAIPTICAPRCAPSHTRPP